MKKMNITPKETSIIVNLPECWISDNGKYLHFKNSKVQRRLPVIGSQYQQILKDMNISFRELQTPMGKTILQYWDKKMCIEYEMTLPLYEKQDGKFVHTGDHTGYVQSYKMLKAAAELQKLVEERKKEIDNAEQEQREAMQKQKYEEVQAKLQTNEKLVGVSFVSTIVPNFDSNSMRIFNLPKMVKDKKYPSYYYVAFDTERIKNKSVIELEVPKGKIPQYMGKQQENVIQWAKEIGVKFIRVVEAAE